MQLYLFQITLFPPVLLSLYKSALVLKRRFINLFLVKKHYLAGWLVGLQPGNDLDQTPLVLKVWNTSKSPTENPSSVQGLPPLILSQQTWFILSPSDQRQGFSVTSLVCPPKSQPPSGRKQAYRKEGRRERGGGEKLTDANEVIGVWLSFFLLLFFKSSLCLLWASSARAKHACTQFLSWGVECHWNEPSV